MFYRSTLWFTAAPALPLQTFVCRSISPSFRLVACRHSFGLCICDPFTLFESFDPVYIHIYSCIYIFIYLFIDYFIYIIYTASIHCIYLSIYQSIYQSIYSNGFSQIEIEICKIICFLTSNLCSLQMIFCTCVFALCLFLIISSSFVASTAFSMVSWLFSYRTAAGFHVETLGSDLPVATETQPQCTKSAAALLVAVEWIPGATTS